MTKDFYSIVYVAPNHLTNEKISVGIILVNQGVPYFKYSMTKLKWLSFDLIKAPVKKHLEEIEAIIKEEQKSQVLRLFNYRFAPEVFEELNKKSRGLVLFEKPNEIHGKILEKDFDKLFNELIGAKPKSTVKKRGLPMRVKWTHWIRQQENLKGKYQFSIDNYDWAKVDYAIPNKNEIKIYHCVDPETSKKTFLQSLSKLKISVGVIEQSYADVQVVFVHGDSLSKHAKKITEAHQDLNWQAFEKVKKEITE